MALVAIAGSPVVYVYGDGVDTDFSGSGSADPGRSIVGYSWAIIAEPVGVNVVFQDTGTKFSTLQNPRLADVPPSTVGDIVSTLVVTDDLGATSETDYRKMPASAFKVVAITTQNAALRKLTGKEKDWALLQQAWVDALDTVVGKINDIWVSQGVIKAITLQAYSANLSLSASGGALNLFGADGINLTGAGLFADALGEVALGAGEFHLLATDNSDFISDEGLELVADNDAELPFVPSRLFMDPAFVSLSSALTAFLLAKGRSDAGGACTAAVASGGGVELIAGGKVSAVSVTAGGSGYVVGDLLTLTPQAGGFGGCVVRVDTVSSGAVTAVSLVEDNPALFGGYGVGGLGYTTGTKNTSGGTGSGCTINVTALVAYTNDLNLKAFRTGKIGLTTIGGDIDLVSGAGKKITLNTVDAASFVRALKAAHTNTATPGTAAVNLDSCVIPAALMVAGAKLHIEARFETAANTNSKTAAIRIDSADVVAFTDTTSGFYGHLIVDIEIQNTSQGFARYYTRINDVVGNENSNVVTMGSGSGCTIYGRGHSPSALGEIALKDFSVVYTPAVA